MYNRFTRQKKKAKRWKSFRRPYTDSPVLFPVHSLVFWRTILHKLALAANLPCAPHREVSTFSTGLRPLALRGRHLILIETDLAIDPIAHLPRLHPPAEPPSSLDAKYTGAFEAISWKPDHFAVIRTAGIGTTAREIIENVFGRNK
jgi:hypothetical protein